MTSRIMRLGWLYFFYKLGRNGHCSVVARLA
jgi:hypothetical protein